MGYFKKHLSGRKSAVLTIQKHLGIIYLQNYSKKGFQSKILNAQTIRILKEFFRENRLSHFSQKKIKKNS